MGLSRSSFQLKFLFSTCFHLLYSFAGENSIEHKVHFRTRNAKRTCVQALRMVSGADYAHAQLTYLLASIAGENARSQCMFTCKGVTVTRGAYCTSKFHTIHTFSDILTSFVSMFEKHVKHVRYSNLLSLDFRRKSVGQASMAVIPCCYATTCQ